MSEFKFCKELYSKIALIKAAYNFTDAAYVHLDADEQYYIVIIEPKNDKDTINEKDFVNEMLAQSVRHEIFLQTKNIRELLYARAVASSIVTDEELLDSPADEVTFSENEILKDWFAQDE